MEITFAWYWIINITVTLIWLAVVVRGFYLNWCNKPDKAMKWHIAAVIMAALSIVSPIKIAVDKAPMSTLQTNAIKASKMLPEKVTDNSFKEKTKIKGISKSDIWSN